MAAPWKSIYDELPGNGDVVWIRVLTIYGELALAEYKTAKEEFETVTTGITIPVFFVGRWKEQ